MVSRSSKWFRGIVQGLMAGALVVVGLVSFSTVATGDAANPNPTTVGTLTPNADGTVTANLSGTWTWDQSCSQRFGTGWAVDWWGISNSATPSPNFSLTNATEVNPPGTTTTGTVSPAGFALGSGPGGHVSGGGYFHVGQFYSGENVNNSTNCHDTIVSGKDTSSGAWSASATYPSAADVPAQLCVNMYDEHGSEGNISNSTKDFDPITNDDNSINTNDFDPTVGGGFCVQLKLVNVPTTTTTNVSSPSITLGPNGTVSDTATVTGTAAGGQPTGTVAFYVCGPTTGNAVCTSIANPVGTGNLSPTGTSGFVSTGGSSVFIPNQAGTWCFAAVYNPATGSPYAGSSDNNKTGTAADANECVTVGAATPTTATALSANTLTLGPNGTVTDTATVTGTANGGEPTGTVAFSVCGPTSANALCGAGGTSEGTANLSATGTTGFVETGGSSVFTPKQAGTYCFAAVYTPTNSNYTGSSDNQTGNLDTNECVTVGAATPTTATALSANTLTLGPNGTVTDTATVTGTANGGEPTGTVAFSVCGPTSANALCGAGGTSEGTANLSATGTTGFVETGGSSVFTPKQAGTYCFAAVYTPTNSNYTGSSDNQTGNLDTNECVTVSAAPSNTSTQASSSSITMGASGNVTDSVTVTGTANGGDPTGTVTFYVCGPASAAAPCNTSTATPVGTAHLPSGTDGGFVSTGTSSSFSPTQVGTYCFAAVFTPTNSNYTGSSDNTGSTNFDSHECFTVGTAPNVTVIKTSNPATGTTVIPGQTIVYTLTASNSGTEASGQEVISDPIPSGSTYVNGSANCNGIPNCTPSFTGTTVTFTLTSVPGLASGLAMTFSVTVNANATTAINNVATFTNPACTNVCQTNPTHNPVAVFSVNKTSNPASGTTVVPGQTIVYTLTATNVGDGATGQEVVTDPIPSGATYVANSANCNGALSCTPSFTGTTVTFTLASVGANTTDTLTFSATVNANATVGINNVATFTGPGCTSGCMTNHTNNPVAVFSVNKTSNPASGTTVVPNQTIVYTLTAANTGDGATGQEVVTDTIPIGSTYVPKFGHLQWRDELLADRLDHRGHLHPDLGGSPLQPGAEPERHGQRQHDRRDQQRGHHHRSRLHDNPVLVQPHQQPGGRVQRGQVGEPGVRVDGVGGPDDHVHADRVERR